MPNNLPEANSVWEHTNGNLYIVLMIANEHTADPEKYPVSVVYQGTNGNVWVRPANDWHRSMTLTEGPLP